MRKSCASVPVCHACGACGCTKGVAARAPVCCVADTHASTRMCALLRVAALLTGAPVRAPPGRRCPHLGMSWLQGCQTWSRESHCWQKRTPVCAHARTNAHTHTYAYKRVRAYTARRRGRFIEHWRLGCMHACMHAGRAAAAALVGQLEARARATGAWCLGALPSGARALAGPPRTSNTSADRHSPFLALSPAAPGYQ